MEKLKRNLGVKLAAGVVFAVSAIFMIISAIFGIVACENDLYSPGGVERVRKSILHDIAWNYACRAVDEYYNIFAINGNSVSEEHFEEYFSEDNCNYAFKIEPLNNADGKYPVLKNYDCEDYQYSYSSQHTIVDYAGRDEFAFDIPKEDMYSAYIKENQESAYPPYFDEYLTTYMEGEDFYITGNDIDYRLNDNPEFKKAYDKFKTGLENKYSSWDLYCDYDETEEKIVVSAEGYKYVDLKVTGYVKSEFTAHDEFYSSLLLRCYDKYIDIAMKAVIPVLVISLILTIVCAVFLISAAGHRRDADGVEENAFDCIPYDIILFAYGCIVVGIAASIDAFFYLSDIYMLFLLAFAAIVVIGLFPVLLMTTSTRIKTGKLFKNTVIFKVLKWLFGIIKKVLSRLAGTVKYLWRNLNVYAKFMGVFALIALFEFIAIAALGAYNTGTLLILWFFEKVVLGFGLAVAVINMNKLKNGASEIAGGNTGYEIETDKMFWEFKNHGDNLNSIRGGIQVAVEERMKSERMKTELITNVSHDIKTPLTSIITYVDLLKKEDIGDAKANEYIEVLDRQSARLKKLIQDLIDASKAATGNMPVELADTDVRVLLEQALGEFTEKLDKRGLKPVVCYHSDNSMAMADGKLLWRTFDNLINNIVKYAQDNTRVYIDIENENYSVDDGSGYIKKTSMIKVTFKNISKEELNVSGDELMERFVRGDSSRNTEGSGLGLSIAKSLIEIQNGKLEIVVDGDLFKVVLLLVRA